MEAMRQRLLAQQLGLQSPTSQKNKQAETKEPSTPNASNKSGLSIQSWRSEPKVKMMPLSTQTSALPTSPETSKFAVGAASSTPTKAALLRRGFPASPGWPSTPSKTAENSMQSPQIGISPSSKHVSSAEREKQLRSMLSGVVTVMEKVDMSHSRVPGMQCTLLPHQVQGVDWMCRREKGKARGGILADDMGLGKTIQMLALITLHNSLEKLRAQSATTDDSDADSESDENHENLVGLTSKMVMNSGTKSTLIIAPVAVMEQWQREAEEKSGHKLSVYIHHGPRRTTCVDAMKKVHIVITSYSTAANEYDQFLKATKTKVKPPATRKQSHLSRDTDENSGSDSEDPDWGMLNSDHNCDDENGLMLASGSTAKRANRDQTRYPLFEMNWLRVVLDEAQNIKNHRAKCSQACYQLSARAAARWCISGTPVQNNALEIFSLIHFLRISPFNDMRHFEEQIHEPLKSGNQSQVELGLQRLGIILKSIMLRRTKDAHYEGRRILDLPPRIVKVVSRDFMTANERDFYHELEDRIQSHLDANKSPQLNYMGALVMLLRLRQACNHPALVTGRSRLPAEDASEPVAGEDGQDEDEELAALLSGLSVKTRNCDRCQVPLDAKQKTRLCAGCASQSENEEKHGIVWGMPGTMSTKLDMMLGLLEDFDNQSKGDKTIVFSQFTSFLDLVEDALRARGCNFTRYDGSMRRNAREEALQRIRTDDGVRVILISFKAGSTGLNLTCCNRVILCDLWWNPQIEEQAFDRAHRLGQTKSVYIYKLSIDGTVEQRILALQVRAQAKSFFDTHVEQKAPAREGCLGWTFVRMRLDSQHRLPQRMLAEQLTKQNGASWILWTCSFCFTVEPSSLHHKHHFQ